MMPKNKNRDSNEELAISEIRIGVYQISRDQYIQLIKKFLFRFSFFKHVSENIFLIQVFILGK